MSLPRIVCPHNPELLKSLHGQSLAVRVSGLEGASDAARDVTDSGNALFCVIVDADRSVAELCLGDDLKRIPLAVRAPSMGSFRNLASKLRAWREFNLRFYLCCDDATNITALRILSSLGIHTCAVFGTGMDDWEAISDLMTYAVLGQYPHAPMEPFQTIATSYKPDGWTQWGAVYFDDPGCYLHLDEQGRVALSEAQVRLGEYCAGSLEEWSAKSGSEEAKQQSRAWTRYFLENQECSCCPGWKACLGRFSAFLPAGKGCASFLCEMLEVVRQYHRLKSPLKDGHVWQP